MKIESNKNWTTCLRLNTGDGSPRVFLLNSHFLGSVPKYDQVFETNIGEMFFASHYAMMFDQHNVIDYSVDKYGFYLKSEAGILSMQLNIDFVG